VSDKAHHGRAYYEYEPPPEKWVFDEFEKAEKIFGYIFKKLGLVITDYYIDDRTLYEVLKRADQSVLHYRIFHNGTEINELKRAAIFSYWVVRLKPVNRIEKGLFNINERIVLELFFSAINAHRRKTGKPLVIIDERLKSLKNDLEYTFTYRDISYDFMTMLIESIAF
jgi:hypothetical protein